MVSVGPFQRPLNRYAVVTGAAAPELAEADIVDGGSTIIITLTNAAWVSEGVVFDAARQDIIDGLTSPQTELTGWNNEVRDKLAVTTVVRTSATVVTITLSAQAGYDITASETITVTAPASALNASAESVMATPLIVVDSVTNPCEGVTSGDWVSSAEAYASAIVGVDCDDEFGTVWSVVDGNFNGTLCIPDSDSGGWDLAGCTVTNGLHDITYWPAGTDATDSVLEFWFRRSTYVQCPVGAYNQVGVAIQILKGDGYTSGSLSAEYGVSTGDTMYYNI